MQGPTFVAASAIAAAFFASVFCAIARLNISNARFATSFAILSVFSASFVAASAFAAACFATTY